MKCRPIFFLTNFPSNELYNQIDAVFDGLSECDFKKKKNKCGNLGFKSECYVYFKKRK